MSQERQTQAISQTQHQESSWSGWGGYEKVKEYRAQNQKLETTTQDGSGNSALNSRSNRNEQVQDAKQGLVKTETGTYTATQVTGNRGSQQSGGENMSDSQGGKQGAGTKDSVKLSVASQNKGKQTKTLNFVGNQIHFPDSGSETQEERLKGMLVRSVIQRTMALTQTRELHPDVEAAIWAMDILTLREILTCLSQQTRIAKAAPAVQEFFVKLDGKMQRVVADYTPET